MSLLLLSSLAKVFPDEKPTDDLFPAASALKNERLSFQTAFFADQADNAENLCARPVRVSVHPALNTPVEIYQVGCVQVPHPEIPDMQMDEDVLRVTPGLYPDVLYPIQDSVTPIAGWNSLFFTLCPDAQTKAGSYTVCVQVGEESAEFTLTVLDAVLPVQTMINTVWFHADCIADRYQVEVFSQAHWDLLEKYFRNAAAFGQTMLYLPLYTPPLDTAVGSERRTVQLMDVTRKGDAYTFDFTKATRWIHLAKACGFMQFEMPHLFTQWGAAATPKIMATVEDGSVQRIFGWDVPSDGDAYRNFLSQFLPALRTFLQQEKIEDSCWFHFSDEPNEENMDSYRRAREGAAPYLTGCRTMDALSHYSIYEQGLVSLPVVATDAVKPFLEHQVNPLWVYYCCGQREKVCNRFICMPSYRNRAIGWQFYVNDAQGFLQWGHNYWYSQLSTCFVDPFTGEPADAPVFPAGDAFIVYPGADGPLSSLRQVVFMEALQDQRACQLLEKAIGRDETVQLVQSIAGDSFAFDSYPRSAARLLNLREAVNAKIDTCTR